VTAIGCSGVENDRTFGVFTDWGHAIAAVERNSSDMHETTFHLLVVEAFVPNVVHGTIPDQQYWFRWTGDSDTGHWEPIERPAPYEHVAGFGPG
jgi:hypothetical protein